MASLELAASVTFSNILVATDFSPASRHALDYAGAITRQYHARLYVAHVLPPEPQVPDDGDWLWSEAEGRLRKACAEVTQGQPPAIEILRRGPIDEILSEVIDDKRIDLLVLGTHGRTGMRKLLMGSVAEELFRLAPCPVLTVGPALKHEAKLDSIRRVLFLTDFGPASLRALPYALDFANHGGGELTLCHFLIPSANAYYSGYPYPTEVQTVDVAAAIDRLRLLLPDDSGLHCKIEHHAEVQLLLDGMVRATVERDPDLIVMGVKKLGSMAAVTSAHLPWPRAHEIVCGARCPVLTVRG